MRIRVLPALIATVLLVGCSSSADESAAAAGASEAGAASDVSSSSVQNVSGNDKVASVSPCSLLTDDEIATQVDLTYEESQREGMRQMGVKHQITKEEDRGGMGRAVCHVSWRSVTPDGDQRARGSFDVIVMTSAIMKAFEGMSRPKTGPRAAAIPGVGDEAFYLEHAPTARAGDVAVSIAEFPDTREGNGAVELLRAAVLRLR